MADIDEAEDQITRVQGLDGSWEGPILVRLIRTVRQLVNRGKTLEDRVTALEARLPPENGEPV